MTFVQLKLYAADLLQFRLLKSGFFLLYLHFEPMQPPSVSDDDRKQFVHGFVDKRISKEVHVQLFESYSHEEFVGELQLDLGFFSA